MLHDLDLVYQIDKEINDHIPLHYNNYLSGGYINMPSAKMADVGMVALGVSMPSPYLVFSANFQALSYVELSLNYHIYRHIKEANFGHLGFGDDADRAANIKLAILKKQAGCDFLPEIAIGLSDFIGSRRFKAFYAVMTKEFLSANLELSLGYGKDRINGFFGGISWLPFRQSKWEMLRSLTLLGEYDASDYENNPFEHPLGRGVTSRINLGLSIRPFKQIQCNIARIRGEDWSGSINARYNFGQTEGLFPKVQNPKPYTAPVNSEKISKKRQEHELAQEFAFAFEEQGLTLQDIFISLCDRNEKVLRLKIINIRYREESDLRNRLERILSALTPSNVHNVCVVVESDGLPVFEYVFERENLELFQEKKIGNYELSVLSPMQDPSPKPSVYEGYSIYRRKKPVWVITVTPRLISFFGSTTGKYKYSLGVVGSASGYLFDSVYYNVELGYSIKSSISDVGDKDKANPSKLLNVRSDLVRYYQTNTVDIEQAYLQKGFHINKGLFFRSSVGYFEPAYAGIAMEALYYPIKSKFAIGVEAATVLKRNYEGFGFQRKIRKEDEKVKFLGTQYFLDLYYMFDPLNLELKVSAGQFLAKDLGARFELTKYYPSGMRFSLWYTITNGGDIVNGETYHDKGVAFLMPLDIFLKKSSKTMLGYAVSAWLRDVGARAETGKRLYNTIQNERYSYE